LPSHFPVTLAHGEAPPKLRTTASRLDPARVSEIVARAHREPLRHLAVAYGVSYETIRRIVQREALARRHPEVRLA
jgi:hypothetical protein